MNEGMTERDHIGKALIHCKLTLRNAPFDLTNLLIDAWTMDLQGLDIGCVVDAFAKYRAENVVFPAPFEIRKIAEDLQFFRSRKAKDTAPTPTLPEPPVSPETRAEIRARLESWGSRARKMPDAPKETTRPAPIVGDQDTETRDLLARQKARMEHRNEA